MSEMADGAQAPQDEAATVAVAVAVPQPTPPADARVSTECPSCGAAGWVDFARRDASAFCVVCDYPLFWARERVSVAGDEAADGSSLRRLPGTAGRAALASLLCWNCTEPNPPSGVTCLRCGADLSGPPPAPVVAAEPEPELAVVEVAPDKPFRWWPYVAASAVALVVLLVLLAVLGVY